MTTASYSLRREQYSTQPSVDAFNNELLRRLRDLPGVEAAWLTTLLPGSGNNNNQAIVPEGYVTSKGANMNLGVLLLAVAASALPALNAASIDLIQGLRGE